MLLKRTKEKLFNTILYFYKNTNHCGKHKLNSLLFLLDFKHYGLIGRNVTGLEYYASHEGPNPIDFHKSVDAEIIFIGSDDEPNPTNSDHAKCKSITPLNKEDRLIIKPLKDFDSYVFSKREKLIMKELVEKHKNCYAKDMIDAIRVNNLTWQDVFDNVGRTKHKIPYDFALNTQDKETILEVILENNQYWQKFK